ncbi:uncharacterized protein [Montipora foliosa]|uniref:uncharacterized protein n=1 Tax=Montipora foliosa TaxID=591990 RepID=UPI0035F0FE83
MAISEEELENEIEDALSVQDTISDYKIMIMEALKNDQHDKLKLPESIRYAIFRSDSAADKSLDKLRIALRREIETIEKGRLSTTKSYETYDEEPLVPTTGTMLSRTQPRTQSEKQRPKQKKCAYCDGNHWSDNRSEFVTVQERYQVLQRQQRCYNCLGTNHNKTKCFSKRRCMKCKQKHHTSFCHGQTQNPPKDTASNPSTSKIEQTKANTHDEPKETHKEKKTHSANTHVGTTQLLDLQQNQILMHSARTTAIGPGFQCSEAHILFDTGSQRTFITENMRNRLNLKTIRKERLDVTTFGDIKTTRRNYDIVSLNLDTGKESLSLTALVTPTICPPVKIKAFKIPPELEGLKLADTPTGNSEADILIGNDQYGHLITGKMIKTSNEAMIAIESKFGWLLAGSTSNIRNSNTMGCHRMDTQSAESQLDSILTKFWETNQIRHENISKNNQIQRHFG